MIAEFFKVHVCGRLILALVLCVFLTACGPSAQAEPEIIHAKLGAHDLYIPKEYVKFRHTSIGTDSALIQAWYPGSAIVPADSFIELWKQGLWWKNVMVLISSRINSEISFNEFAVKSTKYLKAEKTVGKEYGLLHKTQPEGFVQDDYDIWLEMIDNGIASYITCMEQITKDHIPQCFHNVFIGEKFWLKISYDRRFLPEWKTIKENVEAMFESFRTEETAKAFVQARIEEMKESPPEPILNKKSNAHAGDR